MTKLILKISFLLIYIFLCLYGIYNFISDRNEIAKLNIESTYTPVHLEHTVSGDTIVIFVTDSFKYKYYIIKLTN